MAFLRNWCIKILRAPKTPIRPLPHRMNRKLDRKSVAIEIVLESAVGRRPSRISDISLGGCYVESINNYRKGEPVSFELQTETGETLTFTGEITYVLEGFGFGMKFTGLTPPQIAYLNKIITPPEARDSDPENSILEVW